MPWLDRALWAAPLWALGLGYLVFLLAVSEVGIAAGRGARARHRTYDQASLGVIQTGVLGLLGLLLAFTYAQAADRYQNRRRLLVSEANAIGTFRLRTSFLPEADRAEADRLLARYVDLRITEESGRWDLAALRARFRESEAIHQGLWEATTRHLRTRPSTILDGLLVSSLNELIDLHTSRLTAYEDRVPGAVLGLVVLVSALALLLVGFTLGLAAQRGYIFVLALAVAVVAVAIIVVDLDRSHRGLVRTSQSALRQLQRTPATSPPSPRAPSSR